MIARLLFTLGLFGILVACEGPEPPPTSDVDPVDVGADDVAPGADLADVEHDAADLGPALPGASLREGCNPLAQEWDCLLPFPSDAFRVEGRVEIADVATPADKFGEPVRAFDEHTADGFGVHPAILFTLGAGIDPGSLVSQATPELSVAPHSPTLLIDTQTGEAVPHFSEVYAGGRDDVQLGAIRPLVRLDEARRYVVAVQGVELTNEAAARAPAVFAALRDAALVDPALGELQARYDDEVFGVLDAFGVTRSQLLLAWDFTTRSRDDLVGDMLSVRAGTLAWLQSNVPEVTITDVFEDEALGVNLVDHAFRRIEGHFTAPQWTQTDEPGAVLRGPRGAREIVGVLEVPFTVTIPKSIGDDDTLRGPFIQYGHGFFGRRDEVASFVQSKFGDDYGYVMGAVDWTGMTRQDRDWVVRAITQDPASAFAFVPRIHQGMANQLVFTEVVRGVLANEPAMQVGERLAYEPEQTYFLGISQGHILGGTFMALTPTIERAALNVGGASFALILTRSYAFLLYERLLAQWIDPLELRKFEALAVQVLEPVDPIAFAPFVLREPLSGSVAKQVLLQGGVGDTAVPVVSIELHARALGAGLVTPSAAPVPWIDEVQPPVDSGLVLFDFGLDPTIARGWDPVNFDTVAHEGVRRYAGAREQMSRFLRPGGQIEDTCSGPCVVP